MRTIAISRDHLRAILHYEPSTGIWRWIACYHPRLNGTQADMPRDMKRSYRIVTIDKIKYYSHRLAWFYMTGEWPPNDLDHKDLNKGNNAWINLRLATDSLNNANKIPKSRDVPKGVDRIKRKRGFQARIKVNLKTINLGTFYSAKEAHEAYAIAAEKYFGQYARLK